MGFTKGSQEAINHMAKIRSMRKGNKSVSMVNNVEPVEAVASVGRRGRLIKGSPEAKAYMASIRPKK
jgi:hypothetical protein